MPSVAFARAAPYEAAVMASELADRRTPGPSLQRSSGGAELRFRNTGGTSRLSHLYQHDPCRVLFPYPESGDPLQAVVVTTSGGLTDGDEVRIAVGCDAGVQVCVTGQAAEKIYRAAGPRPCLVEIDLSVGEAATLEWLPQETILFDGARLHRTTTVDLAPTSELLACELLAFGRAASGERFTRGLVQDAWRIRRGGRLVWADAMRVEGELPRAAGFGDAAVTGFALYIGPQSERLLAPSRDAIERYADRWPDLRAGTTLVNTILLARFLGEGKDVRLALMDWIACMRAAAFGRPARLPRVWHV